MSRAPQKPLVAIIGATGTGKSELAVDIASRFNGEIINGDAMQMYHGLPIITNKIPEAERKGIPHHLLGCIGLQEETWTVGRFVDKALGVIDEIRARGKLPILVGGTHYYTQSLLFKDALADYSFNSERKESSDVTAESTGFPILDEPTEVILAKLKEVDPVMADRWHPNDRRKIQHSLELYLQTGIPASQIYDEQRVKRISDGIASSDDSVAGLQMRSPTLLLWVHASKEALHKRLDSRILKMLDQGLLSEVDALAAFRSSHEESTGVQIDHTRGIWVSIGYKEFLAYHTASASGDVPEVELEKLKSRAIKATQSATRQYANRQVRWIRIKLFHALASAGQTSNMFLFDGTDLSCWEGWVLKPAIQVTQQFLRGYTLPPPTELSEAAKEMLAPQRDYDMSLRRDLWVRKTCETCGTVVVTESDWDRHIKSRGHRRAVAAQDKESRKAAIKQDDIKFVQAELLDVLGKHLDIFNSDEDQQK
ncbi:tRNA isopentenyltransferase [Lepidopterella palustris CBS 459.81]|uniref:tRNA dimethylallyltransferase n=1 Tax=Lepidopterella palustris CBS 459.81 TaxID=1314670 RepID=A0A8E2EKG5_9PEZI|nr:tRNA isopentenyltransferase [Lepidopterella palustris CBS 459.81]